MGWIRHHGIVVTSRDKELLMKAHEAAVRIFSADQVTEPSGVGVNSYRSFLVAPDGSKEGWPESDAGDAKRAAFVRWLNEQAYEDGSSCLHWIEYEHDRDNDTARVVRFAGSERVTVSETDVTGS